MLSVPQYDHYPFIKLLQQRCCTRQVRWCRVLLLLHTLFITIRNPRINWAKEDYRNCIMWDLYTALDLMITYVDGTSRSSQVYLSKSVQHNRKRFAQMDWDDNWKECVLLQDDQWRRDSIIEVTSNYDHSPSWATTAEIGPIEHVRYVQYFRLWNVHSSQSLRTSYPLSIVSYRRWRSFIT